MQNDEKNPVTSERLLEILKDIAADMANDAKNFDGQPFNGRTVATYFGNQGAAIAALADIVATLVAKQRERV